MCGIPFPWLDRTRNTVEWGVACNGCRYKPTRDEPIDLNAMEEEHVLYTQEQYLAHFANCTKAHELFFKEDLQTFATEERLLPCYKHVCHIAGDPSWETPELDPLWTDRDQRRREFSRQ
jgi:hypothetical protein